MEEQLKAAIDLATNLAARDLAIISDANFIGHVFIGELFFCFADEGNLRNGVDAVGIAGGIGVHVEIESAAGGDAALLHGNGSEAREADDVADRENVRLRSAIVGVHLDTAAIVGSETRGGKVESIDIAAAADGVKQGVGNDALFADQIRGDFAVWKFFNAFDLFAEPHGGATIAHMVAEGFDHFGVGEFEQARTFFNNDDAHAEGSEHTGVFDTDYAAADHDQRAWQYGHG